MNFKHKVSEEAERMCRKNFFIHHNLLWKDKNFDVNSHSYVVKKRHLLKCEWSHSVAVWPKIMIEIIVFDRDFRLNCSQCKYNLRLFFSQISIGPI